VLPQGQTPAQPLQPRQSGIASGQPLQPAAAAGLATSSVAGANLLYPAKRQVRSGEQDLLHAALSDAVNRTRCAILAWITKQRGQLEHDNEELLPWLPELYPTHEAAASMLEQLLLDGQIPLRETASVCRWTVRNQTNMMSKNRFKAALSKALGLERALDLFRYGRGWHDTYDPYTGTLLSAPPPAPPSSLIFRPAHVPKGQAVLSEGDRELSRMHHKAASAIPALGSAAASCIGPTQAICAPPAPSGGAAPAAFSGVRAAAAGAGALRSQASAPAVEASGLVLAAQPSQSGSVVIHSAHSTESKTSTTSTYTGDTTTNAGSVTGPLAATESLGAARLGTDVAEAPTRIRAPRATPAGVSPPQSTPASRVSPSPLCRSASSSTTLTTVLTSKDGGTPGGAQRQGSPAALLVGSAPEGGGSPSGAQTTHRRSSGGGLGSGASVTSTDSSPPTPLQVGGIEVVRRRLARELSEGGPSPAASPISPAGLSLIREVDEEADESDADTASRRSRIPSHTTEASVAAAAAARAAPAVPAAPDAIQAAIATQALPAPASERATSLTATGLDSAPSTVSSARQRLATQHSRTTCSGGSEGGPSEATYSGDHPPLSPVSPCSLALSSARMRQAAGQPEQPLQAAAAPSPGLAPSIAPFTGVAVGSPQPLAPLSSGSREELTTLSGVAQGPGAGTGAEGLEGVEESPVEGPKPDQAHAHSSRFSSGYDAGIPYIHSAAARVRAMQPVAGAGSCMPKPPRRGHANTLSICPNEVTGPSGSVLVGGTCPLGHLHGDIFEKPAHWVLPAVSQSPSPSEHVQYPRVELPLLPPDAVGGAVVSPEQPLPSVQERMQAFSRGGVASRTVAYMDVPAHLYTNMGGGIWATSTQQTQGRQSLAGSRQSRTSHGPALSFMGDHSDSSMDTPTMALADATQDSIGRKAGGSSSVQETPLPSPARLNALPAGTAQAPLALAAGAGGGGAAVAPSTVSQTVGGGAVADADASATVAHHHASKRSGIAGLPMPKALRRLLGFKPNRTRSEPNASIQPHPLQRASANSVVQGTGGSAPTAVRAASWPPSASASHGGSPAVQPILPPPVDTGRGAATGGSDPLIAAGGLRQRAPAGPLAAVPGGGLMPLMVGTGGGGVKFGRQETAVTPAAEAGPCAQLSLAVAAASMQPVAPAPESVIPQQSRPTDALSATGSTRSDREGGGPGCSAGTMLDRLIDPAAPAVLAAPGARARTTSASSASSQGSTSAFGSLRKSLRNLTTGGKSNHPSAPSNVVVIVEPAVPAQQQTVEPLRSSLRRQPPMSSDDAPSSAPPSHNHHNNVRFGATVAEGPTQPLLGMAGRGPGRRAGGGEAVRATPGVDASGRPFGDASSHAPPAVAIAEVAMMLSPAGTRVTGAAAAAGVSARPRDDTGSATDSLGAIQPATSMFFREGADMRFLRENVAQRDGAATSARGSGGKGMCARLCGCFRGGGAHSPQQPLEPGTDLVMPLRD